jgi:predicted Zn-dependent protease with MMP-like domain
MEINDDQFERLLGDVLDELPEKYVGNMQNVAIVYADEPTPSQREKLRLRCDQTLFGLYEGIPLTKRDAGYNLVLPDKITIFKLPLFYASHSMADLKAKVKHTLWHEIAHHFGLGHDRIHQIEREKL